MTACLPPSAPQIPLFASARASAYIYNTEAEVEAFVKSLGDTINFFREINSTGHGAQ